MSRVLVDSGVSWLGKIPDSWSTCRVKNKFLFHKIIAKERSVNYDRIALTLNGVIKRDKDDSNGLQPDNYNGYQVVYKDDLIFKLIDLENSKFCKYLFSSTKPKLQLIVLLIKF